MNVLISSAGRRGSLVSIIKKTFEELGIDGKVFACDCNPGLSAACHLADKSFKVPKVTDSSFKEYIFNICRDNDVKIIVPTLDPELLFYSEIEDELNKKGVYVVVSTNKFCNIFNLKTTTHDYFKKCGVNTPQIIEDLSLAKYPLFAKLNNSSRSIGAQKVNSYEEAKSLLDIDPNYIFQEFIQGDEFTVDVYLKKNGKVASIVPRQRLEVRSGEVSKGVATKNSFVINKVATLCESLYKDGARAVQTIQVFLTPDNEVYFIEINPRFGGGYPLSYFAGVNFFKYIIQEFRGIEVEEDSWKDKTLMLRYDSEVISYDYSI